MSKKRKPTKAQIERAQERRQEKTAEATEIIMNRFKSGDVPEPLARLYIVRQAGVAPMTNWSPLNQFICAIFGCTDARGYNQWKEVGRQVRKGESATAFIRFPMTYKTEEEDPQTGETKEVQRIRNFGWSAVFDITQTEGDPLEEEPDLQAEREFIQSLPLLPVAHHFDLNVSTYSGEGSHGEAYYAPGRQLIALGVENVDTWLHELIHAADDRLGNLKERGQHWRSETVAQFGAATLAILLGMEFEADLGGTFSYIQAYAEKANRTVFGACEEVLERTMNAVTLIMDTAQQLAQAVEYA